ncbi:hypothetical protein GCM10022214_00340 [Actinomadura miaoliensis]|uniref:Uncharacterized protein n=1 Tax=Actinomadura miaoliensis TaxID=430685 RepID=A0ABP7UV64_9ACTN
MGRTGRVISLALATTVPLGLYTAPKQLGTYQRQWIIDPVGGRLLAIRDLVATPPHGSRARPPGDDRRQAPPPGGCGHAGPLPEDRQGFLVSGVRRGGVDQHSTEVSPTPRAAVPTSPGTATSGCPERRCSEPDPLGPLRPGQQPVAIP